MGRQPPPGLMSVAQARITAIAQISDPHVGLHADYADSVVALERAVAAVAAMDPAPVAVLLTGDLTYDGNPAEYERVRELLEPLAMPVHPIPGNHDRRENLRAAFSDHPGIAGRGRVPRLRGGLRPRPRRERGHADRG